MSELRLKNPYLFDVLESLQNSNNRGYVEIDDLGKLLTAFQYDSRIGFSVVSSLRQAIALRENWMEDTCVRGCLCNSPGYVATNNIRGNIGVLLREFAAHAALHYGKLAKLANFGGLVLGCIKTNFCKKICVRQHFSSSTRCASFCTAAISKFSQKIGLKKQQFS